MKLMPVRQSLTWKYGASSYTELSGGKKTKDTEVVKTQEVSQADYCRRSKLYPL